MLSINEMKLVSATHEITRGDWSYRAVAVDELYTVLKRTKADDGRTPSCGPMWNHGVLVQFYDAITEQFEPATMSIPLKFATVEEALKVIDAMPV